MCNKYEGWSNYPTWAVKLWIDNDQGSQEYWLDQARAVVHDSRAEHVLADILKDSFAENNPASGSSVYADLMGWALDAVDWREVAESLLEDFRDQYDENKEV